MSDVQMSALCANDQAPLCYGAITYYAMDSERCGACVFTQGCNGLVAERIKEVSHVIDVADLMQRHMALKESGKKPAPHTPKPDSGKLQTQDPNARINAVAAAAYKGLAASAGGVTKLKKALKERTNPVSDATTQNHVVVEMLLAGPVPRSVLATSLIDFVSDPKLMADAWFAALVGTGLAEMADEDSIELT